MSVTARQLLPELANENEWESGRGGERSGGVLARAAAQSALTTLNGSSESVREEEGEEFLGALGTLAGRLLGEREFEDETEFEGEDEAEFEDEDELEAMANPQLRIYPDAVMAHLSHAAATAENEAEAEAFVGALVPIAAGMARRAAPALLRSSPSLVRGLAGVTRTLRGNTSTRPLVQTLPTILTRTTRSLARQVGQGRAVTPRTAVRTLAQQTAAVLGEPRTRSRVYRRTRALDRAYHRHGPSSRIWTPGASAVRALAPPQLAPAVSYQRHGAPYEVVGAMGSGPATTRLPAGRRMPPMSVAWVPVPALYEPRPYRSR